MEIILGVFVFWNIVKIVLFHDVNEDMWYSSQFLLSNSANYIIFSYFSVREVIFQSSFVSFNLVTFDTYLEENLQLITLYIIIFQFLILMQDQVWEICRKPLKLSSYLAMVLVYSTSTFQLFIYAFFF